MLPLVSKRFLRKLCGTEVAHGPSVAQHRLWNIVLHQHEDGTFTTRIRVNGQLLLPDCVGQPSATTLAYVEAALVDARDDDQLVLRAQGSAGIVNLRTTSTAIALRWLKEHIAATSPRATGPILKNPEGEPTGRMPMKTEAS